MAQCRLPFSFNVVPKLPRTGTRRKRKRLELEQTEGAALAPEPRSVRPRLGDANVLVHSHPPISEEIDHPAPAMNHQNSLRAARSHEDGSFNSPSLALPTQPPPNANTNSEAIGPPRPDGDPTPTLTEVNPETGSITGGARIWLKGINFSSRFPIFARFGTTVVPTVSLNHLPLGRNLINFLRPSPPATFLPVIYPRQPCQGSSTLCYRRIRRRTRRSTE